MEITNHITGSKYALENAKNQFAAAELIASKENYGLASSLMVLAAEEALKSLALRSYVFFPDTKGIDFKEIFSKHEYKLDLIRSLIGIKSFLQVLYQTIIEPELENNEMSVGEITKIRDRGIDKFINWAENEISSKTTTLSIQLEWWNQAKTLKEDGFYVRCHKQGWYSPLKIKKERFDKTKKYVNNFIETVDLINSIDLNQEPYAFLINEMKKRYDELKKKKRNDDNL